MERKFKLKNEELKFKLTNGDMLSIDEKYGNASDVVNSLIFGEKGFLTNSLRIVSESCKSRKVTIDELTKKLTSTQLMQEIPRLATDIYFDYMGIKVDKEEKTEDELKKDTKKK